MSKKMTKKEKSEMISMLRDHPKTAKNFDRWDQFDTSDWSYSLLQFQPRLAPYCDKWDKFTPEDWFYLLTAQPQFADKCEDGKLNQLRGELKACLLAARPQLENKCDLKKLNARDWALLLTMRPKFANKCDKWGEFTREDWVDLLSKRPRFAGHCGKWGKFTKAQREVLARQHMLRKYLKAA